MGSSMSSHDGERMEKPEKIGWSTQGALSARAVYEAGTTGARPRARKRTNTGAMADSATHESPRRTSPAWPTGPPPSALSGSEPSRRPRTVNPIKRTKAKAATPVVRATRAPAAAIPRRSASSWRRNSWRSASRRNHSETKPMVGGRPARVSEPRAKAAPLTGVRRPAPRRVSRLVRAVV